MSFDLLEYPCQFSVKAMGKAAPGFESHVTSLVAKHCPGQRLQVSVRESSQGRYHSVMVEMEVSSAAQVRAIYAELGASERVIYTL